MPAAAHHHRSTTKVTHKSFKSRHATKNDLRDRSKGRVEKGLRQTKQQHVMSKLDRKNRAKQLRINHLAAQVKAGSVFAGREGAPRIVAVIPLCASVNQKEAVGQLNASVDVEDVFKEGEPILRVHVERFKQNVAYLYVPRDLLSVLDACRMADFVVWAVDAHEEVDEVGETLLRAAESQGISNVMAAVQNIGSIESPKKQQQTLASLKSYITHFFPAVEKVNSLDSRQECQNVLRVLCTTLPKGIHWREDRGWMVVEEVRWPSSKAAGNFEGTGEVIITGVVRGRGLKADRLVQVGDWGDFQIEKIMAAPNAKARKMRADTMAIDAEGFGEILEAPTEDQDDLVDLAPEETVMEDIDRGAMSVAQSERKGVLVDDHHYYSDADEDAEDTKPKRLPRGTSKYQAAWYLGDVSDSGSDLEDVEDDQVMGYDGPSNDPADGPIDVDMRDPTEAGNTEYPQSEAFLDPSPEDEADQIAAYREQRHQEAEEDLEFPDEIELLPNVLGRERLARYRGLKNLRTSIWDTEEDKLHMPDEWQRLLEVANYKAARNRILKECFVGGVQPGMRVEVHLRNVPLDLQTTYNSSKPLAMFSLLRHEHKKACVNLSINLSSDLTNPVKSKQEIIAQCGPRRFVISPLFSDEGQTPNDVHKFRRYLHPGQSGVASFIGPLTWGSVPVLYFNTNPQAMETDAPPLTFIGTGTSLAPSQHRVIAKRVVLTGHPLKINKRVVTVRFMFFNTEDVHWFKALRLWTKRGRSGYIKESLGTHGYFKASFDGKINPMDAVAVSLYKRVWPKQATAWRAA